MWDDFCNNLFHPIKRKTRAVIFWLLRYMRDAEVVDLTLPTAVTPRAFKSDAHSKHECGERGGIQDEARQLAMFDSQVHYLQAKDVRHYSLD
ncbi:hypothetical protein WJX81_003720 [Elliptochloris bilobata]|uniref:Uncharacterized protein n=1 Tax=Elliptochloris bilobata TaxID=381761 RepID=A0AAW1R0M0_9CHLO